MVRQVVTRFAELVCPPGVRADGRAERVLAEFDLLLRALRPAARRMLSAAFVVFDQGGRLYPPGHGRRFARMDDRVADGYLRAVLERGDGIAALAERLKGLIVMCYYELPDVQREIGYRPGPYIAAVTRRRLERYGADIRAREAGGTDPEGRP
jgi:hypothetical protein